VAATIQVDAEGLADFGTDGGDPLGKFGGDQESAGESLVVELLELFELAGFESFQGSENSLDRI
jgi:hypothetical protein